MQELVFPPTSCQPFLQRCGILAEGGTGFRLRQALDSFPYNSPQHGQVRPFMDIVRTKRVELPAYRLKIAEATWQGR